MKRMLKYNCSEDDEGMINDSKRGRY